MAKPKSGSAHFSAWTLRWLLVVLVSLAVVSRSPVAAEPYCVGDCDLNRTVSIGEVTKCINVFLGQSIDLCDSADSDGNGSVSIGEVVKCIGRFLNGCPLPTCGDGFVNQASEACDPPGSPSCPGNQTCNPDCSCPSTDITEVVADPVQFLTGVFTDVRFQAEVLPVPGLDLSSVQLLRVDANLNPIGSPLCIMLDNGNLSDGDDIGGDSVFSCFVTFFEQLPETIEVVVHASVGGQTIASAPLALNVVNPLGMQDAQQIVTVQQSAVGIWQQELGAMGNTPEARMETVNAIKGMNGVADAGVSADGVTIWIEYTSGVSGGLMLNPTGTRGGSAPVPVGVRASRRPSVPHPGLAPASFSHFRHLDLGAPLGGPRSNLSLVAGAPPGDTPVGNTNVLIWDAYNSQFAPDDEGPGLRDLFQNSPCPKFTVTYLVDGQADVASVETFSQYGTVVMVTHGALDGTGKVVFLTREPATLLSILFHGIDILLGRLTILNNGSEDVFSVRPSFVSHIAGSMDESIVYNGSCESSANATMAQAFMGKGAKTYYAYTRVVNSDFAKSSATQLFTDLVTNQKNTGDAFSAVTPKVDPTAPNATFTQSGDAMVVYSGEFTNGNFETGDLKGWIRAGDGRVIPKLGEFSPTEGTFMGIVSTGLGFTTDAGSIEQNFCLPKTATQLKFKWNHSSEEYIEWCGPVWPFDDPFEVDLVTESGTNVLFYRTVDTLCAGVSPTTLFFDQSGPGCQPDPGVGFGTGGNDCTVWSTGWQSQAIDISAIAAANNGKGVTLRFSNFDEGDSIFDSAVLLDQVEVVKP